MSNLQEENKEEVTLASSQPSIETTNAILDEMENEVEGSFSEQLLKDIVQSYQEAWNRNNEKYEIKYYLTLTTHKVPTKEGNKDVAYLRLEKAIRSKIKEIEDPNVPDELKVPEWKTNLIHTEAYPFRNLQERLNPKAKWKDYLFQSCIARLVAAGLEYAELLQRMKNTNMEELQKVDSKESNIVVTDQMPAPLSPAEEEYKQKIQQIRESEGTQ